MPTRIHVDFNDAEPNGRITALVEHADVEPQVGHLVVLYDSERNSCQALVMDVSQDGLVSLLPDWTTWNKTMLDALTELMERASAVRPSWPFDAMDRPLTGLDPMEQPAHQFQLTDAR